MVLKWVTMQNYYGIGLMISVVGSYWFQSTKKVQRFAVPNKTVEMFCIVKERIVIDIALSSMNYDSI